MFMLFPLVIALAGEPAPAPSASPAAQRPTPLQEIGRVRALPACVPIVAHANGAITQALENDRTLAVLTTNLRNTDFDKLNWLQRKNAVDALLKQGEAIRTGSSSGDAEIKRLREYAAASPDPQRKAELKTFADALGGALYRQKKAAAEFMRDVTIMRGREEGAEAKAVMAANNPRPVGADPQSVRDRAQLNVPPEPPANYNKQMQYLATVLDDLVTGILVDEGIAADHSIAATSGC